MKAPPEDPKNIGILQPQAGYSTDVHVETHTYSDKPTPINPNDNKTKHEHRKKYAKEGGKKLFDMLFAFVCR
ncbi:hypothetical protein Cantr_05176 [Candida viswanathii]|uniref:Uncharacterized protein n=1 Tax=Candida viswanathii TaxID=5486 RepID=A0A367XSF0_9ASCO|nr:hypothetical protein Cantr_05176 [Candida viswanathii]